MNACLREESGTETVFVVIDARGRVQFGIALVPGGAAVHVATDFNCCGRTAAAKFFAVFSNSLTSVGSAFVNAGGGDCLCTTAALFVAWSDVVLEGDAFWFTHVLGHCKGEHF